MFKPDYVNTEIWCHECQRRVLIRIEATATGNLTVPCPVCDHKHYRYVEEGVITEERWRSSSGFLTTSQWSTTGTSTASTSSASSTTAYLWASSATTGGTSTW